MIMCSIIVEEECSIKEDVHALYTVIDYFSSSLVLTGSVCFSTTNYVKYELVLLIRYVNRYYLINDYYYYLNEKYKNYLNLNDCHNII